MKKDYMADNTEEETSTDSPAETETTEEGQSQEDLDKKSDESSEETPYHLNPRWKEREEEWNQRFEKQEQSIAERVNQAVSEAVSKLSPTVQNADSLPDEIPAWFGGDMAQWKAFKADQKKQFDQAVETAVEKSVGRFSQNQTAQEKAVADANEHFENSINQIESFIGKDVNREELLKYVLDNKIIDQRTQRWDYLKGYQQMIKNQNSKSSQDGNRQIRKDIAGATTKERGGVSRSEEPNVATSKTFADPSNRPW